MRFLKTRDNEHSNHAMVYLPVICYLLYNVQPRGIDIPFSDSSVSDSESPLDGANAGFVLLAESLDVVEQQIYHLHHVSISQVHTIDKS